MAEHSASSSEDLEFLELDQELDCPTQCSLSCLERLPPELLVLIFSRSSARTLTCVAQCSRSLRAIPHVDSHLWRRLFLQRWPHPAHVPSSWQAHYILRDRLDLETSLATQQGDFFTMCLQINDAKRSEAPRGQLRSTAAPANPLTEHVNRWLTEHGFGAGTPPPARPHNVRSAPFHRIGSVFLCEVNGWVHRCDDDSCREGLEDVQTGLLVCPISGRVTERFVHECEERGDPEADVECGTRGQGQLFTSGYECADEAELNSVTGCWLGRDSPTACK